MRICASTNAYHHVKNALNNLVIFQNDYKQLRQRKVCLQNNNELNLICSIYRVILIIP